MIRVGVVLSAHQAIVFIRAYRVSDESAVLILWESCDLIRPWNDPAKDI